MGSTSTRPSWTAPRRRVRRLGIRRCVRPWAKPRGTCRLSVSGSRCGVSGRGDAMRGWISWTLNGVLLPTFVDCTMFKTRQHVLVCALHGHAHGSVLSLSVFEPSLRTDVRHTRVKSRSSVNSHIWDGPQGTVWREQQTRYNDRQRWADKPPRWNMRSTPSQSSNGAIYA